MRKLFSVNALYDHQGNKMDLPDDYQTERTFFEIKHDRVQLDNGYYFFIPYETVDFAKDIKCGERVIIQIFNLKFQYD